MHDNIKVILTSRRKRTRKISSSSSGRTSRSRSTSRSSYSCCISSRVHSGSRSCRKSRSVSRSQTRRKQKSPMREPSNIQDEPNSVCASGPSINQSTEPQPSTSGINLSPPKNILPAPVDTLAIPALDEDLLKLLGDDPSQTMTYGKDIQQDLAIRLQHIATSGLTKESRKELLERYLPPANCVLIDAPLLNPEVTAAVSVTIRKRDDAAITCVSEAITVLLSSEPTNTPLIKLLMDANKLLCDSQNSDSVTRRNFILFNLKKELKDQLQATKIDKSLFSDDLAETLKAISKSGADLKLNVPKPKKRPNKHLTSKLLNWRAPPPSLTPKGNQRYKAPVQKSHHDYSSKKSSRPAASNRYRR